MSSSPFVATSAMWMSLSGHADRPVDFGAGHRLPLPRTIVRDHLGRQARAHVILALRRYKRDVDVVVRLSALLAVDRLAAAHIRVMSIEQERDEAHEASLSDLLAIGCRHERGENRP